jgi:hypothetical protein
MKSQFIKNVKTKIFSIFTGSIARTSRLALQPGDQLVRRHDQGVQRPTAISTTTTTNTTTTNTTTTTTTSKLSTFYVSASVVQNAWTTTTSTSVEFEVKYKSQNKKKYRMRPLMRSLLIFSFVYCYQIYKDLKMSFHHKNYRNSCLVIVIIRFIVIS